MTNGTSLRRAMCGVVGYGRALGKGKARGRGEGGVNHFPRGPRRPSPLPSPGVPGEGVRAGAALLPPLPVRRERAGVRVRMCSREMGHTLAEVAADAYPFAGARSICALSYSSV